MANDLDTKRLRERELAGRLVAPGPKAANVSASECHEISDALLSLLDEVERLRASEVRLSMQHEAMATIGLSSAGTIERLTARLAEMTAARDTACSIAEDWVEAAASLDRAWSLSVGEIRPRPEATGDALARITALRLIGGEGGK